MTNRMAGRVVLFLVAIAAAGSIPVRAQAPPAPAVPATARTAATPTAATTPAAAAVPPAVEGLSQGFSYNPESRRDPFVSLIRRGGTGLGPTIGGARPAGLGGLETAEVTLKGTLRSQGGFVGILLGADNKTYIVRAGDRLLDGTVRSITQNALVILQQVNDPLSLEKQREVRKVLRQTDEAK